MDYDKPPLSLDNQIKRLGKRGLDISDKDRAKRYLSHIGYYRLSAYMIPFEISSDNEARSHQFKVNKSFNDVVSLYIFNSKIGSIRDNTEAFL